MAVKKVRVAPKKRPLDSDNTTGNAELAIAVRKAAKRDKKARVRKPRLYREPELDMSKVRRKSPKRVDLSSVATAPLPPMLPLSDMLVRMPPAVQRLDRLCDLINERYRNMELELRRVNLEVSLQVDARMPFETYLGFTRLGNEWHIVISQVAHIAVPTGNEKPDVRPWGNWSRMIKILCAPKLYELYVKAYDSVNELVDSAETFLKPTDVDGPDGPDEHSATDPRAAASYGAELDRDRFFNR